MTEKTASKIACIILAAGKGTRMRSNLPKVMHKLAGEPMITHALRACASLSPVQNVVVIAPGMDVVRKEVSRHVPQAMFAEQREQLGTGHAVKCGMDTLGDFDGQVLVLYADTPLISPDSLMALFKKKQETQASVALLAMKPDNPTGYGRLVMSEPPFVERIVECKDASVEEKHIPWVWGGVMAFDASFLREGLVRLQPSPVTNEYYLTALLEMTEQQYVSVMVAMPVEEAMGVNSRSQLAEAEAVMQQRLRQRAMDNGATLIDPDSVYFSADTQLGQDVTVHPHVVFGPKVKVASNVEIRAFSHLEGAVVEQGAVIGPFARLRPGSVIQENAHVGNFVELKNSTLGKGAKANHLSYVGDAKVGEAANIGAGTITCNYDGFTKYTTTIGAGAFIGSNSSLVAPVTIGDGAIVGAGSVVTKDVPADALALERSEQRVKAGGATEWKLRKKK